MRKAMDMAGLVLTIVMTIVLLALGEPSFAIWPAVVAVMYVRLLADLRRIEESTELLRRVWFEGRYVSSETMYLHEPIGTRIKEHLDRYEPAKDR